VAVIFDFVTVNNLDSTGIQTLLDVQRAINKYADREVEWHFANINSPSIRNALLAGGFGSSNSISEGEILPVVPASQDGPTRRNAQKQPSDIEHQDLDEAVSDSEQKRSIHKEHHRLSNDSESLSLPGYPVDRYPLFHWNLEEAVRAATNSALEANNE
jgi:sodium-independent sulfate anion transporter 11